MSEQESNAADGKERRTSPQLRELFERACQVTAPLFDASQVLGGAANLRGHAQRTIHETYPDLTAQEVSILVSGVTGFHLARLKNTAR